MLVIALDSGCGNYAQLWGTTSLRGLVNGVLTVEVLTQGVHSGDASGVVASSFRIARTLLERIDRAETGVVRDKAFHTAISGTTERFGSDELEGQLRNTMVAGMTDLFGEGFLRQVERASALT